MTHFETRTFQNKTLKKMSVIAASFLLVSAFSASAFSTKDAQATCSQWQPVIEDRVDWRAVAASRLAELSPATIETLSFEKRMEHANALEAIAKTLRVQRVTLGEQELKKLIHAVEIKIQELIRFKQPKDAREQLEKEMKKKKIILILTHKNFLQDAEARGLGTLAHFCAKLATYKSLHPKCACFKYWI